MGGKLAALPKIDVPQPCLYADAFQAYFPAAARGGVADPYHPKLALFRAQLHFQQLAEPNLAAKSLNERAATADAGGAGSFHERHGVRVQSPNADRENGFDSRAPATIHEWIVGIVAKEINLRRLYSKETYRSYR